MRDKQGIVVDGAKVEVAGRSVYSAADGKYTLDKLAAGSATLKVTQDWFRPLQETLTIAASGLTKHDISLEEMPLKLDPADKTLAESYNKTFDWTKDTLSIVVVPKPTRTELDNAVYYHNPALYFDTSSQSPVTPSPQPDIVSGVAQGFVFPIKSGTFSGKDALDTKTIVDAVSQTTLSGSEVQGYLMWQPMQSWLIDWDATKSVGLNAAGVAVRQQSWGSNAVRPQEIEQVYLHGKEIWVKVVFEKFVKLGTGVTDTDGDGRVEIFARLEAGLYTSEVVDKLLTGYIQPTYNTHGLSKEVGKSLNELYSTTAATVEKYIGQPFTVTGVGTISYPFVVLKHSGGKRNVLLVSP